MATLYQAGENIYTHFYRVPLLGNRQEVLFGRVEKALAYSERLG